MLRVWWMHDDIRSNRSKKVLRWKRRDNILGILPVGWIAIPIHSRLFQIEVLDWSSTTTFRRRGCLALMRGRDAYRRQQCRTRTIARCVRRGINRVNHRYSSLSWLTTGRVGHETRRIPGIGQDSSLALRSASRDWLNHHVLRPDLGKQCWSMMDLPWRRAPRTGAGGCN